MSPYLITEWEIVMRLLIAAVLGSVIGWEREQRNKQAGLKTHLLVCVGSALIMLISIYGFNVYRDDPQTISDPARLAAQVVSGIGFLGAGAIMRHSNKIVSGLTTAATLWVVAAIGLSVGAGFYTAAVATVAIVLVIMTLLRKVEDRMVRKRDALVKDLGLIVVDRPGIFGKVTSLLADHKVDIRNVSMSDEDVHEQNGVQMVEIHLSIRLTQEKKLLDLVMELHQLPGVKEVEVND